MSAPATVAPPRSGPTWTVDDWWALNEVSNGERFELIDGGLLVSPPPSVNHQWAGDRLCRILSGGQGADRLPVLFTYELNEGEYRLAGRFAAGSRPTFIKPFKIELDPAQLDRASR